MSEIYILLLNMYVLSKSFLPMHIKLLSLYNDNIISMQDRQLFQRCKRSLSPIEI